MRSTYTTDPLSYHTIAIFLLLFAKIEKVNYYHCVYTLTCPYYYGILILDSVIAVYIHNSYCLSTSTVTSIYHSYKNFKGLHKLPPVCSAKHMFICYILWHIYWHSHSASSFGPPTVIQFMTTSHILVIINYIKGEHIR